MPSCNVLSSHITIRFLDTCDVNVEVNIAISLSSFMSCLIISNSQDCKIFRWWIQFCDNFSFTAIVHLYIHARKINNSGLFSTCNSCLHGGEHSVGVSLLSLSPKMHWTSCSCLSKSMLVFQYAFYFPFLCLFSVTNESSMIILLEGFCFTPLPGTNTWG